MNNGCICCTVRGDLINILQKIMKRKAQFDLIIIETTGLANPAPVAQTFFADEAIKAFCRLDGIITLVDAKHVEQHLDEQKGDGAVNEAIEQVAFADRLLLNKVDLVPSEAALLHVEARLRGLNKYAPIVRCSNAEVTLSHVMDIRAFELERALDLDPGFLQHGAAAHGHGHGHGHGVHAAPGHTCSEACNHGEEKREEADGTEAHGHEHGHGHADRAVAVAAPDHIHDPRVVSVGLERPGELDLDRANAWIGALLQERGADIYRMKGILAMHGHARKFLFQGVHMMFQGEFIEPWGDMPRVNRLVFIGRRLDREELTASFESCMLKSP